VNVNIRAMPDLQSEYDDAMFDFTTHDYASALAKFKAILAAQPDHFDAQLGAGMCYDRMGNFAAAIVEGHKAEALKPNEQLVHTNLSVFYMHSGDKTTAEKYGLKARVAGWKENMAPPGGAAPAAGNAELQMAQAKPQAFKLPEKFPDMPWKKKKENKAIVPAQPSENGNSTAAPDGNEIKPVN
jgi:tetratricopeptide (TPR) repeat protein